jgi:hypothetical protein
LIRATGRLGSSSIRVNVAGFVPCLLARIARVAPVALIFGERSRPQLFWTNVKTDDNTRPSHPS